LDVTLIERYPCLALPELLRVHRDDGIGARRAGAYIGQLAGFPTTFESFERMLLEIHRHIFEDGEPTIAGRFRLPSEPIEFGRNRRGSHADAISAEVGRLSTVHCP
jgi:hypothetical protein